MKTDKTAVTTPEAKIVTPATVIPAVTPVATIPEVKVPVVDAKKDAFKAELLAAMQKSKEAPIVPEPIKAPEAAPKVAGTITPINIVNAAPGVDPNNLISPIKFAEALGKPPQYIYQLLRTNKVPAHVYITIKSGDKEQPRFLKEEAFAWWNARPVRGQSVSTQVITNPDQIIQRMVDMFQQVAKDNPTNTNLASLSDGLKKLVQDSMTSEPEVTATTN